VSSALAPLRTTRTWRWPPEARPSKFLRVSCLRPQTSSWTPLLQLWYDGTFWSAWPSVGVKKEANKSSGSSSQVTVLQRARNPGKKETFPFTLDGSLKNITIYITGNAITFTLTDPTGDVPRSTLIGVSFSRP